MRPNDWCLLIYSGLQRSRSKNSSTLVPNGFISQQAGTMLYAKIGQLKQLTAVQVKITETATTATVLEVFE